MNDLEERLRGNASRIAPRWDDARDRRVHSALKQRKRNQVRARRAMTNAALMALLVVLSLAGTGRLAEAASSMKRWFASLIVASDPAPAAPAAPPAEASKPSSVLPVPGPALAKESTPEPVDPAPSVAPANDKAAAKAPPSSAHTSPDWRALARKQEFAQAYDALRTAPKDVKDEPQDLLLASDVARLSNHPDEAEAPLRRLLRDHRSDARAPIAAFTLGRLLLQDLKRPAEAAAAFADARALDPNGSLAEDAHAREVEAAAAAGDSARARARAEEYVARYPKGIRLASVKRLGGIE